MSLDLLAVIGSVIAALIGAVGLYRKGRKDVRRETALEAAERYAKTRKDMDDAQGNLSDDAGVLREWLRERGEKRDGDL